MVIGDLVVVFDKDIERLRRPSKRFKVANYVISVPMANFSYLIDSSVIVEGKIDMGFFERIHELLNALPSNKSEWIAMFGEDFLRSSMTDRCVETIKYLRDRD